MTMLRVSGDAATTSRSLVRPRAKGSAPCGGGAGQNAHTSTAPVPTTRIGGRISLAATETTVAATAVWNIQRMGRLTRSGVIGQPASEATAAIAHADTKAIGNHTHRRPSKTNPAAANPTMTAAATGPLYPLGNTLTASEMDACRRRVQDVCSTDASGDSLRGASAQ